MKKSKIVILRGAPATGKTTALNNLRKHKEMNNWIIIDFNKLKRQFEHLGDKKRKAYGKQALFSILKILMAQKENIIFDEMSGEAIRKNFKYYIKKYNYNLIVFEFAAKVKIAIKREAHRRKIRGKKAQSNWIKQTHKERIKLLEKNSITIDTTNLNQKQIVNFILKNIK